MSPPFSSRRYLPWLVATVLIAAGAVGWWQTHGPSSERTQGLVETIPAPPGPPEPSERAKAFPVPFVVKDWQPRALSTDEARGGHTLARHVAKSDGDLRARLAREPGISAASTYVDRETAESIVGRVLMEQRTRVAKWLRSKSRTNLALQFKGTSTIVGRSLARGAASTTLCTDAIVVLKASAPRDGLDGAFFVLTSYPEVRR
jgi:hypothetical protein